MDDLDRTIVRCSSKLVSFDQPVSIANVDTWLRAHGIALRSVELARRITALRAQGQLAT